MTIRLSVLTKKDNHKEKTMKKFTKALVAAFAVIVLTGVVQAAERETFCKPKDLRCESQSSPMGVDAVKPRLSWKLDDIRRGAWQKSYRVLVASTSAKLIADEGDLWDSGKVAVEQSHLIEYGGKPLASGQIVRWKVKVWDKDGAESPWSGPAQWEMGLLKPEDWKGKAITATSACVINDLDWMDYIILPGKPEQIIKDRKTIEKSILPANLYGKDFILKDVPERARLYATALGNSYFALYLNGKRVGDEERTPVPIYNQSIVSYYSVYDITPMLRKGENSLRCINWSDSRWSKGGVAFNMQINGVTKGESSVLAATDASWRHRPSPYVAVGNGSTFEYYDFRIPDPTLAKESVSGTDWSPVTVTEKYANNTFARNIMPAERVIRRVTPVEMFSPAPGVYTFDMGEVITGNIEWKVPKDLPYGTRVIFRGSAYLQRDDVAKRNLFYPQHIEFADTSKQLVWYNALSMGTYRNMMPSVFYVAGNNPPATWRTILDIECFAILKSLV
jgi:alpha-L-rhamnosidase